MSELSEHNIVWAVRKLHPRWRELLGDDGATAAESLLVVAQGDGDDATRAVTLLVALFEEHDALDAIREQIDLAELGSGERLYDPLAGRMGPVAAPGIVYRCPVKGCHVTWRLQSAGQHVPRCSVHDRVLVLKK